jgi:ubiquinone/menaquinone biosynthesis C-methylase UbiE
VNQSIKIGDSEYLDTERTEDLKQHVGDFYAWSRDYWIELGLSDNGTGSGMLSFGLWEKDTINMFDAQENLRKTVMTCLGDLQSGAYGLEIGCGIGGAAVKLVQERDVILTCMDLVPAQLNIGKKLAIQALLEDKIEFRQGSSMDMPFQDQTFDFSYCIESSFHYPDKKAFFCESFRVLKPGGIAVVADITCKNNSLVTFKKDNYFCSLDDYLKLMCDAGFTVEKTIPIGGQVFQPLRAYVEKFNTGKRNKLHRYWNLVLKNYEELFNLNTMGYDIFIMRKDRH